jgi:NAD(P)-dependent dehydrogenase (short-subunit alcohol dehydrogenase family)
MAVAELTGDPLAQFRLDGHVALVTGASSGIGTAIAAAFAAAGAHVVLAARRLERLQALEARIRERGHRATSVALDVTQPQQVRAAFDAIERAAGVVDVLVNNAGVAEPRTVLKTARDSLVRTLDINFVSAWDIAREAASRLIAAQRPGSIINVSSVLASGSAVGYAAYSASKAALEQLTTTLALELVRSRIRVNAIAPGWFVTEMNEQFFASPDGEAYRRKLPAGRTGEISELVGPALLLASAAGSYINGAVLPVDGGHRVALI